MNILYLSDIRFPLERANGIQTMETCAALATRGHEVHLLVRPDTQVPARDPLAFYGLPADLRLRVERAPVFGPPPVRRVGYLALALAEMLVRRKWDIVLSRDLGVAGAALRYPAWLRPSIVYESHGLARVHAKTLPQMLSDAQSASAFKLGRLHRRERRVWGGAEGYFTIARTLLRDLHDLFGPRPRLRVVPNAVRLDPGHTYVPPEHTGPPTVAYAGHLYPWKGADVVVDALARLPCVRGLFIGGRTGESDIDRLRSRVRRYGLTDRVTFTGEVPPPDVGPLLARADILVLPTLDTPHARYTSPMKLFEYMAASRPIVASDLPALREIVEHGDTAVLVAAGDPSAFAAGIRSLLDESAGSRSASERGVRSGRVLLVGETGRANRSPLERCGVCVKSSNPASRGIWLRESTLRKRHTCNVYTVKSILLICMFIVYTAPTGRAAGNNGPPRRREVAWERRRRGAT